MPVGTTELASNNRLDSLYPTGWAHWPESVADLLPRTCWWWQIKVPAYPGLSAQRGITGRWSGKSEINVEVAGLEVQKYRKWIMKWNMINYCLPPLRMSPCRL